MNDRKPTADATSGSVSAPRPKSPVIAPDAPEAEGGWKMPLGPIDEILGKAEATPEPVHSGGLIHRLTHRG